MSRTSNAQPFEFFFSNMVKSINLKTSLFQFDTVCKNTEMCFPREYHYYCCLPFFFIVQCLYQLYFLFQFNLFIKSVWLRINMLRKYIIYYKFPVCEFVFFHILGSFVIQFFYSDLQLPIFVSCILDFDANLYTNIGFVFTSQQNV